MPFSNESYAGSTVLVQGIGSHVVNFPLHRVNLLSNLAQGEVTIAVCPSLPIDGVQLVLGNNVAGNHVFCDGPSPVMVEGVPSSPPVPDCDMQASLDGVTECVESPVFHVEGVQGNTAEVKVVLPDVPSSPSYHGAAQQENTALQEPVAEVCSAEGLPSESAVTCLADLSLVTSLGLERGMQLSHISLFNASCGQLSVSGAAETEDWGAWVVVNAGTKTSKVSSYLAGVQM